MFSRTKSQDSSSLYYLQQEKLKHELLMDYNNTVTHSHLRIYFTKVEITDSKTGSNMTTANITERQIININGI